MDLTVPRGSTVLRKNHFWEQVQYIPSLLSFRVQKCYPQLWLMSATCFPFPPKISFPSVCGKSPLLILKSLYRSQEEEMLSEIKASFHNLH